MVKHECLNVGVIEWTGAGEECSSASGCRDERLSAEVEYAEPISDEVQASEEEGLGWLKDGWNPHPNRWESGKLE